MIILKARPDKSDLEKILMASFEKFYMEGPRLASRRDSVKYLCDGIFKRYGGTNIIEVRDDNGIFNGMAIFHHLLWDARYLRRNIVKIDAVITSNRVVNRTAVYKELFRAIFHICNEQMTDIIFFRCAADNDELNRFISKLKPGLISAIANLYYPLKPENKIAGVNIRSEPFFIRELKISQHSTVEKMMTSGYENRLLNEAMFGRNNVKNLYRAWMRNNINGRVESIRVAMFRNKVAGFIASGLIKAGKNLYGFVDMIVVGKQYRRRGVGTALMVDAIKYFRNKEAKSVLLNTEIERSSALKLYLKIGFNILRFEYTYHLKPREYRDI
jgi:ribosomal protein S18 acetylase RimI-like enzyme